MELTYKRRLGLKLVGSALGLPPLLIVRRLQDPSFVNPCWIICDSCPKCFGRWLHRIPGHSRIFTASEQMSQSAQTLQAPTTISELDFLQFLQPKLFFFRYFQLPRDFFKRYLKTRGICYWGISEKKSLPLLMGI